MSLKFTKDYTKKPGFKFVKDYSSSKDEEGEIMKVPIMGESVKSLPDYDSSKEVKTVNPLKSPFTRKYTGGKGKRQRRKTRKLRRK